MIQYRFSKRLLIIPLVLFTFLLCTTTAWADSGRCGDRVTWSFNESSGTLTISGSGNMDDWYITDYATSQNGTLVYFNGSSAPWWYSDYEKIKTVTINEGVTSIGKYAFWGCSNLTNVTIPNSVTQIGEQAFSNCGKLAEITIPANITSIAAQTFSNCSSLTSIIIPDGVTSIGLNAFSNCSSLTSVKIPSSVANIDNLIFNGCNGLTTAGPIESGCNYEFGWTESIPDYAFCGLSALTSVTIPESVTSIGRSAFSSCSSLTSVTIPDGVSIIDKNTFSHCNSLKTITIPNAVTIIDDQAFASCSNLESVTIPENVILIGSNAFYGCSSLSNVKIMSSVINSGAIFRGCNGLTTAGPIGSDCDIEYSWNESIPDSAFSGCSGLISVTIPSGISSIGREAFRDCSSLENVTIPNTVTSIGSGAFTSCSSLASVTVPSSVVSLQYPFSGCRELTTAGPIGSGCSYEFGWTESIPSGAFQHCSGLISVIIPESVTSIGDYAFYGCSSLTDVYFDGTMLQWNAITKGNNNSPLLNATTHFGSDIPETYSVIYDANGGTGAPEAQEKTENITLTLSSMQPTRESIENGSITVGLNFNDGNNTQFSLTTKKWITYAFIEWNTMASGGGVSYASGADYTANEAVTLFAQWETSTIGDPVTLLTPSRDGYVFRGWATSRDATVGITGDYVPTDNVTLYAVWVAPDLVLPAELTMIDKEAFAGGAFTFVKLSEKTATIGWHAFADCPNLSYIYIPPATTEIDPDAFYNVTNLTILGTPGSAAENYANAHNYAFASFQ